MIKNRELEKFFCNIDVQQNGNLLFIIRIILYETIQNKQENKLNELLELLEIKRSPLLLIKDIDEILQNKATYFDKEMKKKMDGLEKIIFQKLYLALFWQYKTILKSHDIYLDDIFENYRETLNITFFNKLPKINYQILFSILSFHYNFLKLKDYEKEK